MLSPAEGAVHQCTCSVAGDLMLSSGIFESPGVLGYTAAGQSLVQREGPGKPFEDTFKICAFVVSMEQD